MRLAKYIPVSCLFILSLWISSSLFAADDTSSSGSGGGELSPPRPELSECISFCAVLTEQAAVLETNIAALPDLADVKASLGDLRGDVDELSQKVSDLGARESPVYERIFELKSTVTAKEKVLEALMDPVTEVTTQLEKWENEWQAKRDRLPTFKEALAKAPSRSAARESLANAEKTVDRTLGLISQHLDKVLAVQQQGATIRARIRAMEANLEAMLATARGQAFTRSAPLLLSDAYYAEFDQDLWKDFLGGVAAVKWPGRPFWESKGWMVLLQVVVVLLVGASILRKRPFIQQVDRWRFLGKRPLSAGLFVSVWLVGPFYGVVDRTWLFLLWVLAGVSAARLIGGLTPDYRKRFALYALAALVILLQACRLIALPVPLFRLCVLFAALPGFGVCTWQSVKLTRHRGPRLHTWVARLGALVFLATAVMEVLGYHVLALQLVDASLKTVLLVLLGWMFAALFEGWVHFFFRTKVLDGIPRFRSNVEIISRRITGIVKLVLFAFIVVVLLVIWRIYDSLVDAWQGLFSVGFSVGEWKVTLGMLAVVAIAVYASFVLSWIIEGILLERVFPKRGVQRGVQTSIVRLIHYGIIFVGFLLALSLLGVNMKNITIIGGALGVGIGFGLQSIVSNFVSGLILLFERPIKAGDYVQMGERWGEISRIGLRSTVVKTFDRSEVVVPNSDLISNEVTNWTLTDRSMRLRLTVGVAYGSDVDKVIATLKECAEENPMVLRTPAPQVLFVNFGESCLDFELRVWISDIDNMLVARSELNQEIDRTFRLAGIEIAFPQRDLHLRTVDRSAVVPLDLSDTRGSDSTTTENRREEDDGTQ